MSPGERATLLGDIIQRLEIEKTEAILGITWLCYEKVAYVHMEYHAFIEEFPEPEVKSDGRLWVKTPAGAVIFALER
jgi:hypothetical protein